MLTKWFYRIGCTLLICFCSFQAQAETAQRKWPKGAQISEIVEAQTEYAEKNIGNMSMCNKSGETSPHSWLTLLPDFQKIEISDCIEYYMYLGTVMGATPVGMLVRVEPCAVYPYVKFILADEIEYRWVVDHYEDSTQIGDSRERMQMSYGVQSTGNGGNGGTTGGTTGGNTGSGGTGSGSTTVTGSTDCNTSTLPTGGKDGAQNVSNDCGACKFTSNGDIDTDGRGNRDPSKTELPETSFKFNNGESVPADQYSFIVMPRQKDKNGNWSCPDAGKCAKVEYNGQTKYGFVGDCGPENKTGEVSMNMAQQFGHTSTNSDFGGADDPNGQVTYTVLPNSISKNKASNESIQAACEQAAKDWQDKCGQGGGTD